jgi:hypothetical protein
MHRRTHAITGVFAYQACPNRVTPAYRFTYAEGGVDLFKPDIRYASNRHQSAWIQYRF